MREIYFVKPVDNSRLVPVLDPSEPRRHVATLFIAAAIFVVILVSAWQRFDGVQDGYKLEALQKQKQVMLESNRKLKLEEASLGDPVRIDTIARNQLGMTLVSPAQVIQAEPEAPAQDGSVLADARRPGESIPPQVKNVAAAVP